MTLITDLRTLRVKYIVDYSFLFTLVGLQEVHSSRNTEFTAQNKVTRFLVAL